MPHDKKSIYKGSYPELVIRNYKYSNEWYSAYLETYLNKDVRLLHNVGDLRDFRRFLTLLASKTSNILNMNRFSNDLGISISTIKRWLSILEASYIIFFIPAYYKNFGKRIVKSPKIYFYDTGLVSYLVGINTEEFFEKGPFFGNIFENFVISEIKKKNINEKEKAFYFFKTSAGEEIDLIEETFNKKIFMEIKASKTFKILMVKILEKFMRKNDIGFLLYQGKDFPYKKNIKILNYENFLKN
jgi:predicted AAA+ superfamily ATPase